MIPKTQVNMNMIPLTACADSNLTHGAILLYGMLFTNAMLNTNGFDYKDITRYAPLLNVQSRAVSRWLKSLIQNEYVLTKERPSTRGTKTRYYVTTKSLTNEPNKIMRFGSDVEDLIEKIEKGDR